MKQKKLLMLGCVGLSVVFAMFIVGCGRNPLMSTISSGNFTVGVGRLDSSFAGAPVFKAYNSAAAESFIVTVKDISLEKEDGSNVTIWEGSEEVDLAKITSLADVKKFSSEIPAGKYVRFKLTVLNKYKVKGSVVLNGTTYYTKTNHTNYSTGPAELEELSIFGQTNELQGIERWFDSPVDLGSTGISQINLLIDISNFLTYYDGNSSTGDLSNVSQTGMYLLNYLPYAITFGERASKEVYQYTSPETTGTGVLTIIYDSSDNPIEALARPLYTNSSGNDFKLYGWIEDRTWSGTRKPKEDYLKKNSDGTIKIKMEPASTDTSGFGTIVFSNFQRKTHSGSYTSTNRGSGTYSATRIE